MATQQPWAPQAGGAAQVPQTPRRSRSWLWPVVATFSGVLILAVAVTALVTAALVRTSATLTQSTKASSVATAPQYSTAERETAKTAVCNAYEAAIRGNEGQGGVVDGGKLNVPIVLKALNTIVAVRGQLTPAAPPDVAAAAKRYIDADSALTSAALRNMPVDKLDAMTQQSNAAIDALLDACGLPR